MCCGLVAVEVMCTTEALGILKLFSPSSGTVVTCKQKTLYDTMRLRRETSSVVMFLNIETPRNSILGPSVHPDLPRTDTFITGI